MTCLIGNRRGLALLALGLIAAGLWADEGDRPAAARMQSPAGMMVRRAGPDKPWQVVKKAGALHSGDLVVGLSGAEMLSANKAVQLTLLSDMTGKSPFPIVESAVVLAAKPDPIWDLEFTLDRGRVDVINRKDKGPARVKVTVNDEPWELTLQEPGARMALELFGRWARGVPFSPNPGPKHVPNLNMVLLALKGEIDVRHGGIQVNMSSPGPALLEWDNFNGADPSPRKLDELPGWAHGEKPSPFIAKVNAVRKEIREALATKSIGEVIDDLVNSDDPIKRRFAICAMGALDDIPRLADALRNAKHPDVWDNGVLALRHWIGRRPGQDMILFRGMMERKKIPPVQAEIVMTLLHSFGEDDVARPETYELLIRYLDNEELAIRGLANWHLKRLVPEGADFGFDPLAPKDERAKSVQKWRKLIPTGELPPALRPKKDKKE